MTFISPSPQNMGLKDTIFRLSNNTFWLGSGELVPGFKNASPEAVIATNRTSGDAVMIPAFAMQGVKVKQATVRDGGYLIGDFRGFDGRTTVTFENGTKYRQADEQVVFGYDVAPAADVYDVDGRLLLAVGGVDELIEVTEFV